MNLIQRFQPALSWTTEFDRFFNRNFDNTELPIPLGETIHESPDAWILRLDLPGFAKSDINLKATGRTLELTAETAPDQAFGGKVDRQWTLGTDVDPAGVSAKMENGVLTLTLPKKPEVIDQPIAIEIN